MTREERIKKMTAEIEADFERRFPNGESLLSAETVREFIMSHLSRLPNSALQDRVETRLNWDKPGVVDVMMALPNDARWRDWDRIATLTAENKRLLQLLEAKGVLP